MCIQVHERPTSFNSNICRAQRAFANRRCFRRGRASPFHKTQLMGAENCDTQEMHVMRVPYVLYMTPCGLRKIMGHRFL